MDQLKKTLALTEDKIRTLTAQLSESQEYRDESERRLLDIGSSIRSEYKKVFGENLHSLKKSQWDQIELQNSTTEYLDSVIQDYIQATRIKIDALSEEADNKKEAIKRANDQYKQVQLQIIQADLTIEQLNSKIEEYKVQILAKNSEIIHKVKLNEKLISERQLVEIGRTDVQEELQKVLREKQELQEAKQSISEALQDTRNDREALQNKQVELVNEIAHRQDRIDRLQVDCERFQRETNQTIAEQTQLRARIDTLNNLLSAENTKVRDLEDIIEARRESSQKRARIELNKNLTMPRTTIEGRVLYQEFENMGYRSGTKRTHQGTTSENNYRSGSETPSDRRSIYSEGQIRNENAGQKPNRSETFTYENGRDKRDTSHGLNRSSHQGPDELRKNKARERDNSRGWRSRKVTDSDEELEEGRSMEVLMEKTMKIIPLFEGGKHPNTPAELQRYLNSCEIMLESANFGETGRLLRCFIMRLTGDAYQQVQIARCDSFNEMKQLLKKLYRTDNTYEECMMNIRACRQQPGEGTSEFLMRAEKLFKIACCAVETKYASKIERDVVIDNAQTTTMTAIRLGLTSMDIRRHLLSIPTTTIGNLTKEIERYERGLSEIQGNYAKEAEQINVLVDPYAEMKTFMTNGFKEILNTNGGISETISNIGKRIKALEVWAENTEGEKLVKQADNDNKRKNPFSDNNRNKRESEKNWDSKLLECYNCGRPGHFARECRTGTCWECGKGNHDFSICMRKRRQERESQAGFNNQQSKEGGN